MPKKGQILVDKFTGDSFEFLETGKDTDGKRVVIKVMLKSKGQTVDDHIHVLQDETFKVISGRMTYFLNGEKHFIKQGEEVTLPKNVAHNHYNTDNEPVEYIQTISPAIDVDYFIENLFGMINDGKVKNGKLPFLQAMVTLKYLESPSYLASMPRGLQRGLSTLLSPIARGMGYRAIYEKYTGIEK
ncbi:cupin domain-containing protein [Ulvibacterium marinum]|uniref:Cupin domain-containing protein n=1 Tax=Ulvibacterium marinum TaxID=2419782 RepID=A0A3B0CDC0_9FLAO|nr:cupin domain-containing protein [Ulvibacterium marinum]RKN81897.1 cupin domain-containing protein [Ulvibacterium marinum]